MNRTVLAFLVVFFIGITNLSFANTTYDFPERQSIVIRMLKDTEEIVKSIGNDKANNVLSLFKRSYIVGAPAVASGSDFAFALIPRKRQTSDNQIVITPLFAKDRNLSAKWKEVYDTEQAAAYFPDPKLPKLILKDGYFSRIWQVSVLMHEGSHALYYADKTNKNLIESPMQDAEIEVQAYELQTNLLEKVGGAPYKKMLKEEISRLEKGDIENKLVSPVYPLYRSRMDKIFGKPKSKTEDDLREVIFWINGILGVMDKKYSSAVERERKKTSVFYRLYKAGVIK